MLTGLGLKVRSQRGRFYLERPLGEGESAGVEAWGRVTPLADSADLLLEQERRKGTWSEVARGSVKKLMKAVAGDTKGTFHGLGLLDKSLRQAGKGLERLPVKRFGLMIPLFVSPGGRGYKSRSSRSGRPSTSRMAGRGRSL